LSLAISGPEERGPKGCAYAHSSAQCLGGKDRAGAQRAMEAMLKMKKLDVKKLDVKKLEAAYKGK
jgi:hypothetical protein